MGSMLQMHSSRGHFKFLLCLVYFESPKERGIIEGRSIMQKRECGFKSIYYLKLKLKFSAIQFAKPSFQIRSREVHEVGRA